MLRRGDERFQCRGQPGRVLCRHQHAGIALDHHLGNSPTREPTTGRPAAMASSVAARRAVRQLPAPCQDVVGTLAEADLPRFDSVIYIDVLEHIEDDRAELAAAASHLHLGGHLVVLSPAYQFPVPLFPVRSGSDITGDTRSVAC